MQAKSGTRNSGIKLLMLGNILWSLTVHMCICEIYYRIEEKIPKKTSILEFHHVSKKYVDKIDPQSVNLLKGLKIIFIYKQETKKLRKTFFDI